MLLAILLTLSALTSVAAERSQDPPAGVGPRLLADQSIKNALERLKSLEPQIIEEQVRLCEIPAPPFKETARAEAYKRAFQALGLQNVRIDKVGNVLGERPGLTRSPHLVFSGHLDTVFPEGTKVQTTRSGSIIKGPGISDDCRGLAVVLGVIRALNEGNIQTAGTITFAGTVGEEGLGDLRGVKHLFSDELKGRIDRFVSVDGAGLGITHVAVGSLRYRVTFRGPGGHSYDAFGLANPVHAVGRAIARIAELQVPRQPKATFNVGRIGGGTSVNSIAAEAWMEIDMRSADQAALTALDANFQKTLDLGLAEENERWGNTGRLTMEKNVVGNRPAGRMSADAPIVQAAVSVSRALGFEPRIIEGSTDANIAINLGIPAVAIDGSGTATGTHALEEAFDTTNSWQGTARAFLLAIALSQK